MNEEIPTSLEELVNISANKINKYFIDNKIKNKVCYLAIDMKYYDCILHASKSPKGYPIKRYPDGYSGWQGRVWIGYVKSPESNGDFYFSNLTNIHSGTGGYGYYDIRKHFILPIKLNDAMSVLNNKYRKIYPLSTSSTIFEYDFPAISMNKFMSDSSDFDNERRRPFIYIDSEYYDG